MTDRVVIAIATFRRPQLLSQLLRSIDVAVRHVSEAVYIVVVDNDSQSSGRRAVEALGMSNVIYCVEPTRGIVAARNRAIEMAAGLRPELIGFTDDDCVVDEYWLSELLLGLRRTGADIAAGPVEYIPDLYDGQAHHLSCYLTRRRAAQDSFTDDVATNNALVKASVFFDSRKMRFDESFSKTGGSDKEFFLRALKTGRTCVWIDTAVVRERVSSERLSREWSRQRDLRNGQLEGRLAMRFERKGRIWVAAQGLGRMLKAIALYSVVLLNPDLAKSASSSMMRGRGWLRAASARLYEEYGS